jgi:two-component system, OmpR family, phosphate regulon sensor histidine kinase PhoR
MWIALTFLLLLLCVGLLLWSKRKSEAARDEISKLHGDLARLREAQQNSAAQTQAHQLAIFNSMVEGILILDQAGRVQTVNKSLERLFNLTNDIRGQTIMEAFRIHDLLEIAERAEKEGTVRSFELTLPGIQQNRYLEVNAASIRSNGEAEGLILIFHDFTRIKELESVRKEFVANVSHELRTPLTLIKGYVETLIDGAKDDPAVATRFLQTIHKHSNRLAFLIEDLLTLSHLESGQITLQPQLTSIHPIIERVLDELQSPAAQKTIALENHVPSDLLANADADRVEQVISNLVDNAIKYGRAGGHIRIAAEALPNALQISVQDDGPGIPPEARDRIFERFYRVDRARSRDQGGTGLGLAIVKHIVQAHGGKVWVESNLGAGAKFFFTLPHPASAPRHSPPNPPDSANAAPPIAPLAQKRDVSS